MSHIITHVKSPETATQLAEAPLPAAAASAAAADYAASTIAPVSPPAEEPSCLSWLSNWCASMICRCTCYKNNTVTKVTAAPSPITYTRAVLVPCSVHENRKLFEKHLPQALLTALVQILDVQYNNRLKETFNGTGMRTEDMPKIPLPGRAHRLEFEFKYDKETNSLAIGVQDGQAFYIYRNKACVLSNPSHIPLAEVLSKGFAAFDSNVKK